MEFHTKEKIIKRITAYFIVGIITLVAIPFVINAAIVSAPPRLLISGDVSTAEILDNTIVTADVSTTSLFILGQIGIGTSTPYADLTVWATTTSGLAFEVIDSASSSLFSINKDGNVNMPSVFGTTTIAGSLAVEGNGFAYSSTTDSVGIGIDPLSGSKLSLPIDNDATTPTIAFGTAGTGIFEAGGGDLRVSLSGTAYFRFLSTGLAQVQNTSAWQLQNETSNSTNPVFVFDGDIDTGIGRAAANSLSLIGGATELARLTADGNSTTTIFDATNIRVGIGTSTPAELIDIDGNVGIENQGELRLYEARASADNNYFALQSTTSMVSSVTLSLPDADGNAGEHLTTNGSGNLYFTPALLSGLERISSTTALNTSQDGTTTETATCSTDKELLSGGFSTPGVGYVVEDNYPSSATVWTTKVSCESSAIGTCNAGNLEVWVLCANIE